MSRIFNQLCRKRSEERKSVRFVGFVTDVLKRTSRSGNSMLDSKFKMKVDL